MAHRRLRSTFVSFALVSALLISLGACAPSTTSQSSTTAVSASSADSELRPVTYMLDWTPDTKSVGIYVAIQKGWFEEAGLDVEVVPVAQAGAEQAVYSGVADFALSNMSNIGSLSLKGVELTQVLQIFQRPIARWCALESNDEIQRPADLDGTTFASFGANEDDAVVTRMIQADGGAGVYETVTVGTSTFQALSAGRADFGGFYSIWEGVQAEIDGPALRCFDPAEYGVPGNPNAIGIVANAATVRSEPEFVTAFVRAAQRGYEWAYAHPDDAADLLVQAAGANLNLELVRASMQLIIEGRYWGDPAKIADGSFVLGTADLEGAQNYYDFIAETDSYTDANDNVTHTPPVAAELATDEFLR